MNGKAPVRPEVYLAAQRLIDFCKQLDHMSEAEKTICFNRAEEKDSSRLSGLYKDLERYYKCKETD